MPDLIPQASAGPDGALDWYNNSLAKVLGLNPADPLLTVNQLSELASPTQRRQLAKALDSRFSRHVDAETGAITIEQVGEPFVLQQSDEEADPVIADLANNYLNVADQAIAAIDAEQCIPGACGDQIAGIIAQARATIAMVRSEAPMRQSAFQMYLHLNELANDDYGLLRKLEEIYAGKRVGSIDTLGRERTVSSIKIARRALGCFEEAIREIRAGEEEPTLSEISEIVRSCGSHVAAHTQNLRGAMRAAGIGDCELRSVTLEMSDHIQLSGECFASISLDQALHTLESETQLWPQLLAGGRQSNYAAVVRSAQTLRPIVAAIEPGHVLRSVGILTDTPSESREAYAMSLSLLISRLAQFGLSVLDTILREQPACWRAGRQETRRQGGTRR